MLCSVAMSQGCCCADSTPDAYDGKQHWRCHQALDTPQLFTFGTQWITCHLQSNMPVLCPGCWVFGWNISRSGTTKMLITWNIYCLGPVFFFCFFFDSKIRDLLALMVLRHTDLFNHVVWLRLRSLFWERPEHEHETFIIRQTFIIREAHNQHTDTTQTRSTQERNRTITESKTADNESSTSLR